jgi:hypothetical protein
MALLTPNSELTLYIGEAGLQVILEAYQRARPEEFRIVSSHYSDGDPQTTPLNLNDGEWLDYAIRIGEITVDMPPPNPALHSPIPPAEGQFELTAKPSFEFRNFADSTATFDFTLDLWVLGHPRMVSDGTATYVELDLVDLRIGGVAPAQLQDYLQYILSLILKQALSRIRLPTTFNAEDVVYGAIYRPSPGGS